MAAEEEGGVRRWLVDIARWRPSPAEVDAAASLLPPHERPAIARFVKEDDRKRALLSRLLQYALVHRVLGVPFHQISVLRTAEGKPYLHDRDATFPNFNFSASHQGDYVGIASEPLCLVGLDIVSISKPQGETVTEFIGHFYSYLTPHEWSCIVRAGSPDEALKEFYRYWCLKEAYVKATGAGVGFGLHRLEFHHVNWSNISVLIDGVGSMRWKFWLLKLDEMHLASIAKGHPEDAVDSYKKTLGQVNGPEADIWSVGVMLYIFLTGVPSFWAENENGIFTAILRGQIDLASDPWPKLSSGAKDLDKKMLNINPKERLTAFQVLNHPWIKEDGDAPDTLLDNVVVNRLKQFKAMNQFKKAALRIIDGCLSEEEITGLKEMFKNIDKDNSRTITLE